ncbi:MAG TPA: molybdopterin-dependent oxidoreductase [Thermodesulfovibrionales bacterium]|jgi:NADH-quinone oxidoreductase chain G|nr:molybdopterin-dependent oxidoreductase [Thermodesulfovibrionales bacterium]
MITVTINEKKISLERPVTILEAARSAGISIPTLCHHDILEAYGGCRLCLVQVENLPRLQTACTLFVTDGMVVRTETKDVVTARRAMLEFLLINHPLDCPFCDKAGECDLQDLAMKYGPATGRFAEGKRTRPESFDDPLIVRNMERCILCSKCVRMCEDVQGASAIAITNRGTKSFVEPFSGGRYNCEYCGNCLTVCPVGAILSRLHRHDYRSWLIEKDIETVCSYCGVGCSMILQVRENSIVRTIPRIGLGLNKGLLCGRGRFGYDYVGDARRLESPLIRRDGELRPASWSEALTHVAQRLKEIKKESGGEAIAGIASGRCTNEDIYVFQKFFRQVLGSNNLDSAAGLAYGPAQRFFEKIFGQGITANFIYGIPNSDGVFVIGGDPTSVNPVLGLQIRAASRKGVPVVTVGYAEGLKRFSRHLLIPNSSTETVLLAALVSALRDKKPLSGERPFFEKIIHEIQSVGLKDASDVSGVGQDELAEAVDTLSGMTNTSVIIGREIVQTTRGEINLLLLAALVYLLNGRIYLLSELPNEQGLLDMGCQPDMLPCGRPLAIETFRKRCEETLGSEIPSSPGLGFAEVMEAAHGGRIKALYAMGENVALSLPHSGYVRDALEKIEFLVVQDAFLTETARMADVVIPAPLWGEKEGSFTNLERRVQTTRKAIDGKGVEAWKAIAEMSNISGFDMGYKSVTDVLGEIAGVSLLYRGATYEDMRGGRYVWPYRGEPLRHDAHMEGIALPDLGPLLRKSDTDGKVYVSRDVSLFHSENASRYSAALKSISPEAYGKISRGLAERLSVRNGDYLKVSADAGSIRVSVQIDPLLPEDVLLVPNFETNGVFEIMKWKINPVLKVPVFDGNAVSLEKSG